MIRSLSTISCALLFPLITFVAAVNAQDVQQFTAPPPLKVISPSDRTQIDSTKDAKSRVRKTIQLAEAHMKTAETHTEKQRYDEAAAALGKYQALIEDSLKFVGTLTRESNRTRDLYKRIELALRAHAPRLISMRRVTPTEYSVWIKDIEEFARSGRTEALNSFYGHTVVRDAKPVDEKSTDKQSKGTNSPDRKEP